MANRILRDWTQSETIDKLTDFEENVFVRLIMKADDYGCYYGNPKVVKGNLFPLKEELKSIKVQKAIEALVLHELIAVYDHNNKTYIYIYTFGQRLRQMKRKFPEPPQEILNKFVKKENNYLEDENETDTIPGYILNASAGLSEMLTIERCAEKILSETKYLEVKMMQHKQTKDGIKSLLNEFNIKLTDKGLQSRMINDYREHFSNWLPIYLSKQTPAAHKPKGKFSDKYGKQ